MITNRLFKISDAQKISVLVATTMLTTNSKDYSKAYLKRDIAERDDVFFIRLAKYAHLYIFCDDKNKRIAGCGAIGPYWNKRDESCLFNIFVHPDYQGHGLGRQIILTLEGDIFFKRAKRIEVPASITAVNFYRKMGYTFKGKKPFLSRDRLYHLEKFNLSI